MILEILTCKLAGPGVSPSEVATFTKKVNEKIVAHNKAWPEEVVKTTWLQSGGNSGDWPCTQLTVVIER